MGLLRQGPPPQTFIQFLMNFVLTHLSPNTIANTAKTILVSFFFVPSPQTQNQTSPPHNPPPSFKAGSLADAFGPDVGDSGFCADSFFCP
jgi:hypothetical protein